MGGYSQYGIDSADFSHTLCENMSCAAHGAGSGRLYPGKLLSGAYERLIRDQQIVGGASTACVGTLGEDGVLMVAK